MGDHISGSSREVTMVSLGSFSVRTKGLENGVHFETRRQPVEPPTQGAEDPPPTAGVPVTG